jgi:hypothetical protein
MTVAAPFIALTLLLPTPTQAPATPPQAQSPASSAQAQSADPTVAGLDLRPGEKVIVTAGRETLRGRVYSVADDGLVLDDRGVRRTVRLGDLDRLERRRDSVWNGALIGYATGFGLGFGMVISNPCGPQVFLCFDGPGFGALFGAIITGPIGMAAGAIADALIRRPRFVFERGSTAQVRIAVTPAFGRGGAGLRIAIAF